MLHFPRNFFSEIELCHEYMIPVNSLTQNVSAFSIKSNLFGKILLKIFAVVRAESIYYVPLHIHKLLLRYRQLQTVSKVWRHFS